MTTTPARVQEIREQIACSHESRTGGNDYQLCNGCGLMWDYRRETAEDAWKRQALDLLASLQAEHERQSWQPIETAPKDGTRILLGRKQIMSGEMTIVSGHWNSGDAYNLPHWSAPIQIYDATHWMPLPASPETRKEQP